MSRKKVSNSSCIANAERFEPPMNCCKERLEVPTTLIKATHAAQGLSAKKPLKNSPYPSGGIIIIIIIILILNSTKHGYNQLGSPQIRGEIKFQ